MSPRLPISLVLLISITFANTAAADAEENGIGFASVAQALEHLKSRPGVEISTQGKWTIVDDTKEQTLWSFTPADHPAHPAVVRRAARERDGYVVIEMSALCQAAKAACDSLMAEFQAMNDRIASDLHGGKWAPSDQQKTDAINTVARFQHAVAEKRFRDAYEMLTSGMKDTMTLDRFVELQKMSALRNANTIHLGEPKITWHKDPPDASAPGVFAAFDFGCPTPKVNLCAEVVVLHEGTDKVFRVMGTETNYIDKETEQQLRSR